MVLTKKGERERVGGRGRQKERERERESLADLAAVNAKGLVALKQCALA